MQLILYSPGIWVIHRDFCPRSIHLGHATLWWVAWCLLLPLHPLVLFDREIGGTVACMLEHLYMQFANTVLRSSSYSGTGVHISHPGNGFLEDGASSVWQTVTYTGSIGLYSRGCLLNNISFVLTLRLASQWAHRRIGGYFLKLAFDCSCM